MGRALARHVLHALVSQGAQVDAARGCSPEPSRTGRMARCSSSIRRAARYCRNGTLPRRGPARIWAGPSVGALCTVCEKPIVRDQLEYEVEFPPDSGNPGLDKFHFHLRCFAAWEFERTKLEAS